MTINRKYRLLFCLIIFILGSFKIYSQVYSFQSGDWNDINTWVGGNIPLDSDNIIIHSMHNVSLSSGAIVNGSLTVNGILTLSSNIGGDGQKIFNTGANLNLNGGTFGGGGDWILNNGAITNFSGGGIDPGTSVYNHGTFNWQSGFINEMGPFSCFYSTPPPAYFINEEDGVVNLNAITDVHLGRTNFINHGIVNKNNATEFSFHNGCSGSPFENTGTATLNHNNGSLVFTSGTTVLGGIVNINGVMNVNSPLTTITGLITNNNILNLNTTSSFDTGGDFEGMGIFNNNGPLNFLIDYTFDIPAINNNSYIGGIGIKTYDAGFTLNNNNGTFGGGNHIISNGATVIFNGGGIDPGTSVFNHGTFNWQSGFINEMGPFSCFYSTPPPAYFFNELDGELNLNATSNVHLGRTYFTNSGVINKNETTEFAFQNGCSGSPFINSSTGVINGIGSILFLSGSTFLVGGEVNPGSSPGSLSFNNSINFDGTVYNCEINGTTVNTEHDQLNTVGEANLSLMTLNVDWGNFIPVGGQSFMIMTFGSRVGEFANVNVPPIGNLNFEVQYNGNNVTIAVAQTYYLDFDQDGFGNVEVDSIDVMQPLEYVSNGLDCNDDNENEFPGQIWYIDLDNDNFGGSSTTQCERPLMGKLLSELAEGSSGTDDCNDDNGNINLNAQEVCNDADDDCDGMVDEGTLITFYQDADIDGFGNAASTTMACIAPMGYVSNNTDCNDNNISIHPQAQEICDSENTDEDCDGLSDDGDNSTLGQLTWYQDLDSDTYGNPNLTDSKCDQPSGYVHNDDDCNDNNENINPEALEICDGLDNDCDGLKDGEDPSVGGIIPIWFADSDNDEYGDVLVDSFSCNQPVGFVSNNLDCNDALDSVNPNVTESCNEIDDDCDGIIDEGTLLTFYQDSDGDNYGNILIDTMACQSPINFVANSNDCNDMQAAINPAAQEICNGIDDDCDNLIDGNDESAIGTATWYADIDNDGYGDPDNFIIVCSSPGEGFVINSQDCDDSNANINPEAAEICNEKDDDCDTWVDEEVQNVYYTDSDMDGFGNANDSTFACNLPLGHIDNNLDCNDGVNTVNPMANEVCDDIDNDCNGAIDELCGCTEETAHNYNPLALYDDGSCESCNDGIKNGDELGVDCGGSNPACSICPPPVASCYTNTVNIYVNPSHLVYNGPGAADVYLVPASFLNNNSSGSGNYNIEVARLNFPVASSSSATSVFNWTTNGACIDATPGLGINDNDKGYSWKSCLPVTPADFNKIRNYKLRINDDYGTSMCITGKYKIIFNSGGTNPNLINYDESDLISVDQNESMLIYPNPGADHITIELNLDFKELDEYSVLIYDALGRKIKSVDNIQSSLLNIETSDLSAGAYNLILKSAKGMKSKIWIKM